VGFRQIIPFLIDDTDIHRLLVSGNYHPPEFLLEVPPNDKDHPVKARPERIVNGVIENEFPRRANRVDLFQPPVSATHSRSQDQQCQTHIR
jgi:hypothetical protein